MKSFDLLQRQKQELSPAPTRFYTQLYPVAASSTLPQTVSPQTYNDNARIEHHVQFGHSLENIAIYPSASKNTTGLPDTLKAGIETLSGIAIDNVRVHYNSSKPAQLQARAYTQGTDIHVGPQQERHLAHEAWHVVQQKQGRVPPSLQLKETVINTDAHLEQEADVMGRKASVIQSFSSPEQVKSMSSQLVNRNIVGSSPPIQAYWLLREGSTQPEWVGNTNNPPIPHLFEKTGMRKWKYRFLPALLGNVELDVWRRKSDTDANSRLSTAIPVAHTSTPTRFIPSLMDTDVSFVSSTSTSKRSFAELDPTELRSEIGKRVRKEGERPEEYADRSIPGVLRALEQRYSIDDDDRTELRKIIFCIAQEQSSEKEEEKKVQKPAAANRPLTGRIYAITNLVGYQNLTLATQARIQERIDAQNQGEARFNWHVGVGGVLTMDVTGTEFGGSGRGDVRLQFLSNGALRLVDHANKSYLNGK